MEAEARHETEAKFPTAIDALNRSMQVALDKYSFIRDAFLQRRKAMLDSRKGGEHAVTQEHLQQQPVAPDQNLPVYDDPDSAPSK